MNSPAFLHHAYGLAVASNIALPHLDEGTIAADRIEVEVVPTTDLLGAAPIVCAPGVAGLTIPGMARFVIRNGNSLKAEMSARASGVWEALLLGAPLAAALYQRGCTLVRGAIVTDGVRAVLIMSTGGGGVSTMVAALLERGWRVQSDGFVALSRLHGGDIEAAPGLPFLKLWSNAIGGLNLDGATGEPVRPGSFCRWVPLQPDQRVLTPVTPTAIVELVMWNRPEITGARSTDVLRRLVHCQYQPVYGDASGAARRFEVITRLAMSVPFGRLHRPWRPFDPRAQVGPFLELIGQLPDRTGVAA